MPRPIPPPPPQASAEETRLATRLSVVLFALSVVLFIGVSPVFAVDGLLVDHGRKHGLSWNLLRLQNLDMAAERAHDGGRIVWLVGPSILRDALDEDALNEQLAANGAELRAIKLGTDRGAPGIAAGIVARLPLREGDLVVSSASASNFRPNWLGFADMPVRFVTRTSTPSEFWQTSEFDTRERLEGAVTYVPADFWAYREEAQIGASKVFEWYWDGPPKRAKDKFHTRFRKMETHPDFTRGELGRATVRKRSQGISRWDAGPHQFNRRGLARMQASCDDAGVPLLLVDFPPAQLMQDGLIDPQVETRWVALKDELGFVTFERPPDDAYYDYMHTNALGRDQHTGAMAELLQDR